MLKYIFKKLLMMIPILLGLTIILFLILHLAPGDPVHLVVGPNVTPEVYENVRRSMGLDRPLIIQYFDYLSNLVKGDLGSSILQHRPVADIVLERFPITIGLGVRALLLSFLIAVPVGIIAAVNRNKSADFIAMTFALVGISMPTFWFGIILLYFFAYKLGLFPISGYGTWKHLVLPVITMGLTDAAVIARMMRSSMLEVIGQDYIRTARAKGLREKVVTNKHALKNALIPVITLLGMRMGWIIGGSVTLEIIFSIPGLGRTMVDSIFSRDYPVVQGSVLILATSVMISNLIADILYALVDPRIRY
ncbi:MAG TPA: ABC transporter permease [Sedimentibacter sp.]|jgi:peptide/nickel transport system permease protein|nr:ABC transporter permease [Sedimentibacter sp.]NLA12625.1 ABC transporter permease [Tissierellia bacterium]HAS92396.1 glutathione ABC transporter permease GsiC [Clostridiales bacterium]HOA20212.1 ABC transporter permease [Sedimentibacter sp.]HOG62575.1 ABC transporter permease [Sedimentibacter sp.]